MKFFFFACALIISPFALADTLPSETSSPALQIARQTFEHALEDLNVRVQACRSQVRPAASLQHKIEMLKPTLPESSLITGIAFLAARNREECEANVKGRLALAWMNYQRTAEFQGIQPAVATAKHMTTLLTVSSTWFEMAAQYQALPNESRDLLERAIGTAPFGGVGLLRLMRNSP